MAAASDIVTVVRARRADSRDKRRRRDLIARIGELVYAQRSDPSAGYDAEIERLVEEIRHLERVRELRHRRQIAEGD